MKSFNEFSNIIEELDIKFIFVFNMYSNNYLYYFYGNELSFLINKNSKTIWLNENYWFDKTKSGEYINKKLNLYDYDVEYCDFEYINNMKKIFL